MNNTKIELMQILKKNHILVDYDIDSIFVKKVKLNKNKNMIEIILASESIVAEEILDKIRSILKVNLMV